VNWPADGAGAQLPVELSVYRFMTAPEYFRLSGFGVCRDIDGMARLPRAQRGCAVRIGTGGNAALRGSSVARPRLRTNLPASRRTKRLQTYRMLPPACRTTSSRHFTANRNEGSRGHSAKRRAVSRGRPKAPTLTAVESNAFDELARQLSARLENSAEHDTLTDASVAELFAADDSEPPREAVAEPPALNIRQPFCSQSGGLRQAAQDLQLFDRLPAAYWFIGSIACSMPTGHFSHPPGTTIFMPRPEAGGLDASRLKPVLAPPAAHRKPERPW
jgi:hypothetical protein